MAINKLIAARMKTPEMTVRLLSMVIPEVTVAGEKRHREIIPCGALGMFSRNLDFSSPWMVPVSLSVRGCAIHS